MRRVPRLIGFIARSAALVMLLGSCLVGFSCVRHGDVGPYPELDFMWTVPPVAMLLAFLWMGEGEY